MSILGFGGPVSMVSMTLVNVNAVGNVVGYGEHQEMCLALFSSSSEIYASMTHCTPSCDHATVMRPADGGGVYMFIGSDGPGGDISSAALSLSNASAVGNQAGIGRRRQ